MQKSLLKKYPKIAQEWHPTKNNSLTPNDVLPGSHKKVWWLCSKGHEFEQSIGYHVKSKSCPICSGRKVSEKTSLAALFPKIAAEWHSTKNGSFKPTDFRPGSQKKIFWQCPQNTKHVYRTSIYGRTKNKTNCPFCERISRLQGNSLQELNPDLIKEWDYNKNQDTPEIISIHSHKKVWWICKDNPTHSYQALVIEKIKGKKCTICNPPTNKPNVLPKLKDADPKLLKEWDHNKNKDLNPDNFTAGSQKKVWWICPKCGHNWETSILNRYRQGKGCPKCAGKITPKEKTLSYKFPRIAKEWHPSKNGNLKPQKVSYGSGKKVWWICSDDKKHEWQATVRDRTKRNPSKCPFCNSKSSILKRDFPEIAKEWHPTRNKYLIPENVTAKSNKKVWWQCSNNPNHEWKAVIKNRTILKSGCPECFKEKADINTTKELIDSIISSHEVYENYKVGIDTILKLLNVKIWDRQLKKSFYQMIYVNIVTLMESYLSDTFIKTVASNSDLQRKYIESNPRFQKEKVEISNVFNWLENIEKNIEEELLNITFHNIWKVQKMYEDVLAIAFPDNLTEIQEIILIRHDLVHRNGKTKEGHTINIGMNDVKLVIDRINRFILSIENQFISKFSKETNPQNIDNPGDLKAI